MFLLANAPISMSFLCLSVYLPIVAYNFIYYTSTPPLLRVCVVRDMGNYSAATFPMVLRSERAGQPMRAIRVEKVMRSRAGTSNW